MISIEKIKQYIIKGISYYDEEIAKLNSKNTKSTKYMYNKGAIDALTNMINYISNMEELEQKEKEENNTNSEFKVNEKLFLEGVIPTSFDLPPTYYDYISKNSTPIVTNINNRYTVVGYCNSGINQNLIYIKGYILPRRIREKGTYNHITTSILIDIPVFVLSEGEPNFTLKDQEEKEEG